MVERPSSARVYDYLLGGAHNFAVDRRVAEQVLAVVPEARQAVQANRAFLRRAVGVPGRSPVSGASAEPGADWLNWRSPLAVAYSACGALNEGVGEESGGPIVQSDDWVPPGIDADHPSPARVYDYLLGGGHNFAADRRVAERVLVVFPEAPLAAQANRAFLRRAVEFLVGAGIRQFLDIGSGIPSLGHVHEIAQRAAPDARVVYVDIDPVAVAHSREVLAGNDRAAAIQEDLRRPERILDDPDVQRLLDFDQPVAVLLVAVFHLVSDADDSADLIARLTAPLVPGSYMAVSHATDEYCSEFAEAAEIYRSAGIEVTSRSRKQIEAFFDGWDLVEPGVVWAPQWRSEWPPSPDDRPERSAVYGGVARKP